MKVSELILRVNVSRGTYYNHINKKDLPFEILEMYGKALRYDFSEDFPKMPKYSFAEDDSIYGTPKTLEEALRHIDYWKTRYIQLSDKYREEVEKRK